MTRHRWRSPIGTSSGGSPTTSTSPAPRLGTLYQELTSLNENLEKTIEEQVSQLRRTEELRRYVSPQVAEAVVTGRSLASLTSTRRNLTVLVSDIRGFTEMSERMEPEELVDSLNEYFTMMTDVVFEHGGTLDKYMGDAILAFFGDPIPFEDDAERAVATALQMRASLDELREQWLLRYDEELVIGIGISTGYVTVGNIGSPTRTEYTVIGNHVNIASRLSETTRSGQILAHRANDDGSAGDGGRPPGGGDRAQRGRPPHPSLRDLREGSLGLEAC